MGLSAFNAMRARLLAQKKAKAEALKEVQEVKKESSKETKKAPSRKKKDRFRET